MLTQFFQGKKIHLMVLHEADAETMRQWTEDSAPPYSVILSIHHGM